MFILEAKAFTSLVGDLLSEDEYRRLQLHLVQNPAAGVVLQGTGGIRKLRWAASGRGKRGGARVIYYWRTASDQIVMLFIYAKNELDDLTITQRRTLRKMIESEYP